MRALGIDLGEKRIGIAVSDDGGMLATPYETIRRVGDHSVEHGRIIELIGETGAQAVVVGVPYSLDGGTGPAASSVLAEIRGFRKRLARAEVEVVVDTQDERFSTVTAERALRAGGLDGRRRRQVVDATAAAVLLQAWLDRQ